MGVGVITINQQSPNFYTADNVNIVCCAFDRSGMVFCAISNGTITGYAMTGGVFTERITFPLVGLLTSRTFDIGILVPVGFENTGDTIRFTQTALQAPGSGAPIVSDNALTIFRSGIPAVDVLLAPTVASDSSLSGSLNVFRGFPFVELQTGSPLSDIGELTAKDDSDGAEETFLTNRTTVGSFVLFWQDDANFVLLEVNNSFSGGTQDIVILVETVISVGTLALGQPVSLYVLSDTALFLRSVERNLFTDQWQPRAVVSDPFVPIQATVTYNANNMPNPRYEAVATGGTGTLNYAWTFEIDGIRFRLDQIPFPNADETDFSAITNADRMNFGGTTSSVHYDPTTLFPGHVVSNIGLTVSDDTHDEFFAQDLSNVLFDPNQLHVIYLDNWRTASGLAGPVTPATPVGTVVLNWAFGHALDDIQLLDFSFDGSQSEFGPYSFNGLGDAGTILPVTTRLGFISLGTAITFGAMNPIANWELDIVSFGSLFAGTTIRIGVAHEDSPAVVVMEALRDHECLELCDQNDEILYENL